MARASEPRVVSVRGAKGGVGTSMIAANMALYLASLGKRVVAVDADPRGADLGTWLGLTNVGAIAPLQRSRLKPEVVDTRPGSDPVHTGIDGLRLWHAGLSERHRGADRRTAPSRLLAHVRRFDADYVVIDQGVAHDKSGNDIFNRADRRLLVTTAELTSIAATYRAAKRSFLCDVRDRLGEASSRQELDAAIERLGDLPAPIDLVQYLDKIGSPIAAEVRAHMEVHQLPIVVNQAQLRNDFQIGDWMSVVMWHRMRIAPVYLGGIDYDDVVLACLRKCRPLMVESPGTKAARMVEKVVRRLLSADGPVGANALLIGAPLGSHYDLLQVDRGYSDQEIRRACRLMTQIYAPDSPVLHSLVDPEAASAARSQIEEGQRVLLDPVRRADYERTVLGPPVDAGVQAPPVERTEPPVPPPDIGPSTEFSGALLRAVRRSKGVRLSEVSDRTKVGLHFLESIENDAYADLPAPVYVRGFVTEFAKMLDLDPERVSGSYVRHYDAYRDAQHKR